MKHSRNKEGAITIIFVTILALIVTLLLAATQSRLLLSVQRSKSATDTIIASYRAETEANDIMARLLGGYLTTANISPVSYSADGMTIEYSGKEEGDRQTVDVSVTRGFAVTRMQAIRDIKSVKKVDEVEMILSLDCTGSMDKGANCANCYSSPTRFESQKEAALDFIQKISELEDADKFKVGVSVFGIDAKWLSHLGRQVTPEKGLSFSEISQAIETGFGRTKVQSTACQNIMDATSVGSAFSFSHDYFSEEKERVKQIEIVITDGEPNSRIPSPGCGVEFCPAFPLSPDGSQNYCEDNEYGWSCYQYESYKDGPYEEDNFNQKAYDLCRPEALDFLRCSIADNGTFIPELGRNGVRRGDIDAYAVTIFDDPPSEVVSIFRNYTSENGYYNASRASQLKNILNIILNQILTERSTIYIKRIIPETN